MAFTPASRKSSQIPHYLSELLPVLDRKQIFMAFCVSHKSCCSFYIKLQPVCFLNVYNTLCTYQMWWHVIFCDWLFNTDVKSRRGFIRVYLTIYWQEVKLFTPWRSQFLTLVPDVRKWNSVLVLISQMMPKFLYYYFRKEERIEKQTDILKRDLSHCRFSSTIRSSLKGCVEWFHSWSTSYSNVCVKNVLGRAYWIYELCWYLSIILIIILLKKGGTDMKIGILNKSLTK